MWLIPAFQAEINSTAGAMDIKKSQFLKRIAQFNDLITGGGTWFAWTENMKLALFNDSGREVFLVFLKLSFR